MDRVERVFEAEDGMVEVVQEAAHRPSLGENSVGSEYTAAWRAEETVWMVALGETQERAREGTQVGGWVGEALAEMA